MNECMLVTYDVEQGRPVSWMCIEHTEIVHAIGPCVGAEVEQLVLSAATVA